MSRSEKVGLLGLLLLGALLRFGGMSHDLHEGQIYHPDSPKQIHAVQQYYNGKYFRHIGNWSIDGYPLFHAHLMEYLLRAVEPARRGVLQLLGVPPAQDALLDTMKLYWSMLLMNATFSTLSILLVFKIGREHFSAGVAWIAAAFQAVSPIDVTAAHLATGDATAAFFSLLSLFFAFRILRRGFLGDYVLAAVLASCAFAAKYYAAMAFFPILAAHLARTGPPRAWVGAASLWRLTVVAVAAVAGLFIAIPGLFGHFQDQLNDILVAMKRSGQRLPKELGEHPSRWEIVLHGQMVNLPVLVRILSPTAAAALLVGFATRVRREAQFWLLLVGPAAYWVFGVGSRAQTQPVFHAVMTAPVFLLMAQCAVHLWQMGSRASRLLRAVTAVAIAVTIGDLSGEALRELFFQWHMDTRRMAGAWIAENVPRSFSVDKGRYTPAWTRDDSQESKPAGTLYLRSGIGRLPDAPAGTLPLKRFVLERAPLTQFRNIQQEVFLAAPALIRQGFSLPATQRWPAQTGNQVIFVNGREFLRSERLFALVPGDQVERWLVSETPLREAWVVARVGAGRASVRVRFGGTSRKLDIPADGAEWFHIEEPRPQFPSGDGLFFYRIRLNVAKAQVRVLLATNAGEAGRMLFNAGRYADAVPLLDRSAREEGDPAAAALALTAARIAVGGATSVVGASLEEIAARAGAVTDDESLFAAYGVHASYLDALPFLTIPPEQLGSAGFRVQAKGRPGIDEGVKELVAMPRLRGPDVEKGFRVWTADLMLDPGHYRLDVLLRALREGPGGGEMRAVLVDVRETVTLAERRLELPPLGTTAYSAVSSDLTVPPGFGAVRLYLKTGHSPNLAIGGLEIQPKSLVTARALAATWQTATTGDCAIAAGEPLAYDALQSLGAQHADEGAVEKAAGCYAAAAALLPGRAAPVEALRRLLPRLPADRRPHFDAVVAQFTLAKQ